MSPKATTTPMARYPVREKRTSVPTCPTAYPRTTDATMAIPPIVGVPALATWLAGPSSLMCWPISRLRK